MLTATVSHEMMTPLNCILTFASILLKQSEKSGNNMMKKQFEMIRNSAQLVICQMKDLLDQNLLEKGQFTLNLQCFNLEQTLSSIVDIMKMQASLKKVRLN